MKLENMKEFLVLAQAGSYGIASEKLYISQSSLSRHIRDLEAELGVTLFDRTTRKVQLTEEGMIFLSYAKRGVKLQEEYQKAFSEKNAHEKNTLKIGNVTGWENPEVTECLTLFQRQYPEIRINMINDESDRLLGMLRDKYCDFAFIREENCSSESDNLNRYPLYKDRLKAYVPQKHRFAGEKTIALPMLCDEFLMMSEEYSLSYIVGMKACLDSGFKPEIFFKGNRSQTLEYLRKGLGVALMFGLPESTIREYEIVELNIVAPVYTYINLVYDGSDMSPLKKSFLDFLCDNLSVLKNHDSRSENEGEDA